MHGYRLRPCSVGTSNPYECRIEGYKLMYELSCSHHSTDKVEHEVPPIIISTLYLTLLCPSKYSFEFETVRQKQDTSMN